MNPSVQNLEEAATIASEFISSLDNLPSEVQHLLQEIRYKELRSQELQQEIAKDQARYIRHSLRHSSPSTPGPSSGPPAPTGPKPHIPGKVAASYAEIDKLSDEKIALAQRIVDLLGRTRARLDADLAKVRVLQGEGPDPAKSSYGGAATPVLLADAYVSPGRNAAMQISESLKSSYSAADVLPLTPVASVSIGPSAQKKRRLTTHTSIKLPSPAPQPASTSSYPRSRLSRQIHPPRPADEDIEPDAEGDEDVEGDDAEDPTLYCYCQKQSAGEMMIGCDNTDCAYQWFHISCVGVKQPLPDKWYCPECKSKGAGSGGRKGRKK